MDTVTNGIWYWLAGAIFVVACGLFTVFLKKLDKGVEDVKKKIRDLDACLDGVKRDLSGYTTGCAEKHKSIDLSLAEGRNRFGTMEGLLREEVRSINLAVQALCTTVGELKGSIDTAIKLNNERKGT